MNFPLFQTTGLTGLAVSKYPQRELGALYVKLLRLLGTLPQDAAYRIYTEKIIKEKNDILQKVILQLSLHS